MTKPAMVEIENVNLPGRSTRAEARRYGEMRLGRDPGSKPLRWYRP